MPCCYMYTVIHVAVVLIWLWLFLEITELFKLFQYSEISFLIASSETEKHILLKQNFDERKNLNTHACVLTFLNPLYILCNSSLENFVFDISSSIPSTLTPKWRLDSSLLWSKNTLSLKSFNSLLCSQ